MFFLDAVKSRAGSVLHPFLKKYVCCLQEKLLLRAMHRFIADCIFANGNSWNTKKERVEDAGHVT